MSRYSDTLLDYARYPRNLLRNDQADAVGCADLAGQPPQVEIFLSIDGAIITRATFQAAGCGVTIAAASAVTELVAGRPIDECRNLNNDDVVAAVDGVPADKRFCVDVALAALKDALSSIS